MAIFEKKAYGVQCDGCKKIYRNEHSDLTLFVNKNTAMEESQDDYWLIENGKCYCPDCYEIDQEDNVTIKNNNAFCKGCKHLDKKNMICDVPTNGKYMLCSESNKRCNKYQPTS